jgi:cell division protein FtsI/penicillin-binding protein 2
MSAKRFSPAKDNRLRFVSAIIFALGAALVGRLFFLQVERHDYYLSKADKQQYVRNTLKAERGKILVNGYAGDFSQPELVETATNRSYATVYAIPKDIPATDAPLLADLLYQVFDRAAIEKAVDNDLSSQENSDLQAEITYINGLPLAPEQKNDKIAESTARHNPNSRDSAAQAFFRQKRDLDINEKRQQVVQNYLSKLDKPGDPYEILQKKVDEPALLNLYAGLLSGTSSPIVSAVDLEAKNAKIYKKASEDKAYLDVRGISFEMEKYRYYPENNIGSHIFGFVNSENIGNYGLEGDQNAILSGKDGYQGSQAQLLTSSDKEDYAAPQNGSDLVLTIDDAVQFKACSRLNETVKKLDAAGGSIIIVDPESGGIIAMCSAPDFDPNDYQSVKDLKTFDNPAISYQYEPGSVFKIITMASAIDKGKVTPETTYDDPGQVYIKGWPKPIKNSDFSTAGGHGQTNMVTVLEKSLNTGAIFAMQQIGSKTFADYVKSFGFGTKTGVELSGEASGDIKSLKKSKIVEVDAATASFGQGIAVTPLQMVMSYAALANGGVLMKPHLIKEVIKGDVHTLVAPEALHRVVSATTADTIGAMLVKVVDNGHAKAAAVPGYYVGAKTGTAQIPSSQGGYLEGQYIHTMVGYAPIEKPRFVMLVKIDNPNGIQYAESSAAPLFGEIADFLLKYYQVPKTR